MEEKIKSHQINWLPAIQFAVLPLMQLIRFIQLQFAYPEPEVWMPGFAGYLNILWAIAYILLALALFTAKKDKFFVIAFTFPLAISLVCLILHHRKLSAVLDLITYASLHFVVLSGNKYLRKSKAARFLSLLPTIAAVANLQVSGFGGNIFFYITFILALLITGIWAVDPTTADSIDPELSIFRLAGTGLISFGFLFLISKIISVVLHYIQMQQLAQIMETTFPNDSMFGTTLPIFLICVMVSACAIYGGILLCHKKPTATE